jgi:hypothetical protein
VLFEEENKASKVSLFKKKKEKEKQLQLVQDKNG